jgi:DNA-directed RNA polymerase I, II, and III subunit RPABC2
MDTDDVIDSGMDMEDEFYEEEFDSEVAGLEEGVDSKADVKPELKRLYQQHPECTLDYVESVVPKISLKVSPPGGNKVDSNHRTYPFLTNYEKTKIIGLRANQLSKGAAPFINVPEYITDVRDIARLELEQKRLPFIIKRPLPNGKFEYWRLIDLLIL